MARLQSGAGGDEEEDIDASYSEDDEEGGK